MSDDRRPKMLLSLDGGGVKGWSQLDILYEIIRRIKEKIKEDSGGQSLRADEDLKESQIYPCEYFDLIVGSGTGGINAILIGRLGLSIKECFEAWEGLDEVFKVDYDRPDDGSLFSAEKLEKWAKDLVEKHTEHPETMMLIKNDTPKPNKNQKTCRVGVTSMRAQNIGLPAVFRSYRVRANAGIDCAIWEVLRATTAAPLLFKSVFIGRKWAKQEFINAELGANNPISYLYQEKQKVWLRKDNWPPAEIGCVISVGSGKDSIISLPSEPEAQTGWTRWFRNKPDFDLAEKLYDVMLRIAKDCERKHQEIEATYGPNDEKVYYRLNVEQGMQDLPENNYDEETRINIKSQVKNYLAHGDVGIYVEGLIDKIVGVLGAVDPAEDEAVPAYEPRANENQAIIEKAKGVARSLGATNLDWAMAGVKEWVHKGSEPPRARFTPSLTSRPPPPGNHDSADEGTFSELVNGDSLETGVMYDPEDGKFKPYEEIWHDLPASGTAFILESVGDLSEFGNSPEARKTWVAMIGEFQLMVERLGVETYNAWAVSREKEGGWKILSSTGDDLVKLISPVNPPDSSWKVGDTVTVSGREWIVKEFFSIA